MSPMISSDFPNIPEGELLEVDAHDFVATGTARGFDADRIADFLADKRTGQR